MLALDVFYTRLKIDRDLEMFRSVPQLDFWHVLKRADSSQLTGGAALRLSALVHAYRNRALIDSCFRYALMCRHMYVYRDMEHGQSTRQCSERESIGFRMLVYLCVCIQSISLKLETWLGKQSYIIHPIFTTFPGP